MHEFALMDQILDTVITDAAGRKLLPVHEITLVVGELANIMPEALEMAFQVFRDSSRPGLSPEASLVIRRERGLVLCQLCNQQYEPEDGLVLCPVCGLPGQILAGQELTIEYYAGGDDHDQDPDAAACSGSQQPAGG